jgi:hypothetical protein
MSARPAAAQPAGCSSSAAAGFEVLYGNYYSFGLTWNDDDEAYESEDGHCVIWAPYHQVTWHGPYTLGGMDYDFDIVWEIDLYDDNGNFLDYWQQEHLDWGFANAYWLSDSVVSPVFNGDNPESAWDGSGFEYSNKRTIGYDDNASLIDGEDTH